MRREAAASGGGAHELAVRVARLVGYYKQYIVVAVGGRDAAPEWVALRLP